MGVSSDTQAVGDTAGEAGFEDTKFFIFQ